jgi:hypothetical protein
MSSTCVRLQNDGDNPESIARRVNAHDVNWSGARKIDPVSA